MQGEIVFFDCEADPTDQEQWGVQAERMQCTCACACSITPLVLFRGYCEGRDPQPSEIKRLTCWRDRVGEDGGPPFERLLLEFDRASLICGYNVVKFDFPLIRRYYGSTKEGELRYMSHLSKTWDPIVYINQVTGSFFKLSDLLRWNGLAQKTASGEKAIQMWQNGQRDELKRYCRADVDLTAQLCCRKRLSIVMRGKLVTIPMPSVANGLSRTDDWKVELGTPLSELTLRIAEP